MLLTTFYFSFPSSICTGIDDQPNLSPTKMTANSIAPRTVPLKFNVKNALAKPKTKQKKKYPKQYDTNKKKPKKQKITLPPMKEVAEAAIAASKEIIGKYKVCICCCYFECF